MQNTIEYRIELNDEQAAAFRTELERRAPLYALEIEHRESALWIYVSDLPGPTARVKVSFEKSGAMTHFAVHRPVMSRWNAVLLLALLATLGYFIVLAKDLFPVVIDAPLPLVAIIALMLGILLSGEIRQRRSGILKVLGLVQECEATARSRSFKAV